MASLLGGSIGSRKRLIGATASECNKWLMYELNDELILYSSHLGAVVLCSTRRTHGPVV